MYSNGVTGQSDLYCYFYIRGLQMLRAGGTHIFICSNSWLDVGYGAKLQELLLRDSQVHAIYESAVEKQFSTADINTVISVIEKTPSKGTHHTRFISLREEFEKAVTSAESRREVTVSHSDLMEAGRGAPDNRGSRKFVGDKWGGKYLRAPDIYWTVVDKARDKLVRLGDIATTKHGLKTGANRFFCLDETEIEKWEIEGEFLEPVMTSPKEARSLAVEICQLPKMLFVCHKEKRDLAGTAALEYILWGESEEYDLRSSLSSRRLWYDLGQRDTASLAMNYVIGSTARTFFIPTGSHFTNVFHTVINLPLMPLKLCAAVNSTLSQLMINLTGRANLGGGALKMELYEFESLPIADPRLLPDFDIGVFETTNWDVLSPSLERKLIDEAVFDVLGLTRGERDSVYEGVTELIENRRLRARSV